MSRHARTHVSRALESARAPHEARAQERAWAVVRTAYGEHAAGARPRPPRRRRLALVPAIAIVAGILALTPAGAAVHRWIDHTLGVKHARAALFSLPAPGRVLVGAPSGIWTVAADGSKRRLGPYREATWSPRALYVAVSSSDQLSAVTPLGVPRWSVARPDIRFPEWFAPSGYRVAYLSAGSLRVIAGDGTDDRQLAAHVALVAPAWRSGHPYQLAYALANGSVVLRDADSTLIAWSRHVPGRVRLLAWSANGRRLLVLSTKGAFVFDGAGRRLGHIATGAPLDGALSPDGNQLALLSHEDVVVIDLKAKSPAARRLFTGDGLRQLTWSPDGRWLLVTWPAANQWVFVHARGRPRIIAVSNIARQFGSRRRFPSLEGWCCA